MKIEKVNDHQIRCTLTREDLASRRLKLSELAYGTDKAKDLFRDMMEKANDEYGFEANDIPLMIEAIPISGECIVLIITKVEDPEELDTRFSKFAPSIADSEDDGIDSEEDSVADATTIADLFKKFKEAGNKETSKESNSINGMAFIYKSFTELSNVSKKASVGFTGESSVYRNPETGEYLLALVRNDMLVADFVSTCNFFAEYGEPFLGVALSEHYLIEHWEIVIKNNALQKLTEL